MTTILLTGFGPFPGAPFNPTWPLVKRLAQKQRAGVKIVPHIFATSYAAVDRDLPKLIARYKPDAIVMFGLASRARGLRVETRAQNAIALLPDVTGKTPRRGAIAAGKPAAVPMPMSATSLLAAIHFAGVPTRRSRDAGTYLCNYLCWRAAEAAGKANGPRLAAFVHVPLVARGRQKAKTSELTLDDLARAGAAALTAIARHV